MRLSVFQPCDDHTGERPYWDSETGNFYWIDVFGQRIHRRAPGGDVRTWHVPALIGSLGLIDTSRALVSLHGGFFIFSFDTGACELVGYPHPAAEGNVRLNDGKTDPAGRFVCSGADFHRTDPIAGLYQVYPAGAQLQMRQLDSDIVLGNGLAWSLDGSVIYYSDSARRTIYSAPYDVASGDVGARRVFAQFGQDEGLPDGATVDLEDHLWVAMVYGGKLVRLRPDGTREREYALPVKGPTSVAFGGPSMDRLFITTKSRDKSNQPLDPGMGGSVLVLDDLPAPGRAEPRFKTA